MKRSGRLNPWGRFLGLAIFGLLIVGSGPHSTQAGSIGQAQALSVDQHSGLINQNDGYDWSGNWTAYIVLPSGYIAEMTLTITGGSGSAYTATTYLCEIQYYTTDIDVDDTGTQSFWVEEYGFRIHMETFWNGIQVVTCDAFLNRTTHPDQLAGKIVEIWTHELLLNDWPPPVVPLSSPTVYENPLCAARNGAGMPEPCGAEPTNGLIPVIGGSVPAPPSAPTSAPPPEAQNPQPEAPPIQEAGPPPSGEESFPPPVNSDETSIPIDWNMVSPAGQAAAAAATTALLAAWLFMESQGTTQGSSSNDLVDTILRETNYYDPAEAGQYLAANTADILDHLNKPPAATSTPQPSAAVSGDSAGPESPTGDKPSSAYNGPISGITTEVFSGRDAFLILQALQIIPQEMTQDNLFEVKPGDLDYFLNSHEDGKPQRVILPNGNEVFVSLVRGVTFEDFQHDDTTNTSTIDFTRGIAIAVDVVKPGLPASTPGDTGDQPADTPGTGQDEASTSDDESESQMADEAAADDLTGTQETDEETADEPIEAQETDGETADGFPDDEAETGDTARIRTPEQDEAELDRFFGDTGRSDSQGQGMGGGSLESGGDQDFDEGTIGEEAGLEAGDAEGLASEAEDSEAAGSGALHRRTGADDIDDKIDSLFEELEARRRGEIKPPDSDSAGGGESGSSQAGIIDGDESGSAKDDF